MSLASDTTPGPTIALLGRPEAVIVPKHYALLLELTMAWEAGDGVQRLSVAAAMIALCCPAVGRLAAKQGLDYARSGFSPLAYGREVHAWMHAQGVPMGELSSAGAALRPLIAEAAFPSPVEVDDALGKSPGPGAS